jgi:hypothetical protein
MRVREGTKMDTPTKLWLAMRAFRWLAWIAFLLYALHYVFSPQSHLTPFGHLYLTTEISMFGLGLLATFAGMFELALRGRAGRAAPKPFRLMAPKTDGELAPIR